ncbi:hemolysin family protein [Luteolibacter sp. GHJ8]|uniref:Hemolysin family protein n=1 Tax=Luteolibacter rhizosphaerae TaxID=2989719 RepID=A0ABT3G6V8_9BACT|nr:hemolysin family protein [Luteolibacter rhizosphaerae]MCW1915226.1 hemolysin family protein [Luteolibacter rhizosphaerae]
MTVLLEIALIFVLLFCNGLFAMTEIAIVSSRRGVLQARAEAGSKGAEKAILLADAPDRFLSTVQIGITLVGICAGAFGGARLSDRLADVLDPIPYIGAWSGGIAWVVVLGMITYLQLVVGELVPKRLAMKHPESIASGMAGFMSKIASWTSPAVSLLAWSTSGILRLFGVKDSEESKLSREELTVLIREGMVAGGVQHSESRMMEGVLEFESLDVYDIMIPRPKMVWIDRDEKHAEVWPRIVKSTQGFFPVYQGQRDNLVGVISVKDCYAQLAAGIEVRFANLMQPPLLVPEVQKASLLLEDFRRTGHHAAFVVDEFGGVIGMVTLIDLMEAIVGDVPSKEERLSMPIKQRKDGSWLIDGLFEIEKLENFLKGFVIPEGAGDEYQTIAGWFSQRLARVPTEGDIIEESNWRFEIVDMDGIRVDKVLAMRIPKSAKTPAAV